MAEKETRGFATEARQLLHLMIHSLYSNREIFIRELISNAADAADKLRFEALTHPELASAESGVWIEADKTAKTLTIRDTGIGMSRDEVIENLGTIAHSGTAQFVERMTGEQRKDAQLIGQFGVGFYSAFIVADHVTVLTRRAGAADADGTCWESSGEADYTLEPAVRAEHGTEIVLHLKADAEEFLDDYRLRSVIRRYSDHISIPVHLRKSVAGDAQEPGEFEAVNQAKALWSRSRSDVTDDEYKSFYKHVTHAFDEPLIWSHNKVEGNLDYTSLLYVPTQAPFDLWSREAPRGLKLYVRRVFIMDQAEQFLPMYLRFVKGVLDCADLPLNVSREILQQDKRVDTIKQGLTKRVLDMLKKLSKDDAQAYAAFWTEFGRVLKEAPAEDFANRDEVAKLLRFATTHTATENQDQSLEDYVARLRPGQDRIYYVCADNHLTAAASPHLEVFKKRNIEVLLLSDRIDDWVMTTLAMFDGKRLTDISRGDLGLDKIIGEETDEAATTDSKAKANDNDLADLLPRVKAALGDAVADVRLSQRLVSSPVCLVIGEHDMGAQMRRLLEAAGQDVPDTKPTLELNGNHALIRRLDAEIDEQRFGEFAHVLLDQARLAEGAQLPDPGAFVGRLNRLLVSLSGHSD